MASSLLRAGAFALVLTAAALTAREWTLREQGHTISYDDGPPLWSHHRARVYQPADAAVVFIGSSRIKYDLDLPTWRQLTGTDAVQLAIEGNSPRPILHDLAEDENFRGRLVVDVTEGLFFSNSPFSLDEPRKHAEAYHQRTPSEKASFQIARGLESRLVLLDKDYFSMNAFFKSLPIPDRPGVFRFPHFPKGFGLIDADRQNRMTDAFLRDTGQQNQVIGIWNFFRSINTEKPPAGAALDSILASVKSDVDRIRSRGGQVLFVRTPSSGAFWMGEQMGFPRAQYWDRLLQVTGCPGIHFADYDNTAHFVCPELSHLSPADAIRYTERLIPQLREKGWRLPSTGSFAHR